MKSLAACVQLPSRVAVTTCEVDVGRPMLVAMVFTSAELSRLATECTMSTLNRPKSSVLIIRQLPTRFEINMIFYDAEVVDKLRQKRDGFQENSQLLTLSKWQKRPRYKRVMQNIIRLLSPVL